MVWVNEEKRENRKKRGEENGGRKIGECNGAAQSEEKRQNFLGG